MRIAYLFALLLAACHSSPPPRPGVFIGYFGGCDSCSNETQDHTNLYMTRPWGGGGDAWIAETIPQLQQASANGQKVMLGLPGAYDPNAEAGMRTAFGQFRGAGLTGNIVALYPIDEPDLNGKTDAEVTATNAMLRGVMADYGMDAAIAVIYQCVNPLRPGLASYDWIGCDDYGSGCDPANGDRYKALKKQLAPTQRLMLVPGGANPWRQDPQCFVDAANGDSQVVAIVPFLWVDWDQPGIRVNGMRPGYCRAGRSIKGTDQTTC